MKALNRNKTGRIRRSYFTLMELVAAAGIMLSVAGIIAFASRSFFRALASAERVSAQLQVYLNIDQLMDGCFRNMIPFNWETTDVNDDTFQVFDGLEDSIHFTTLRRSYDDIEEDFFPYRDYEVRISYEDVVDDQIDEDFMSIEGQLPLELCTIELRSLKSTGKDTVGILEIERIIYDDEGFEPE